MISPELIRTTQTLPSLIAKARNNDRNNDRNKLNDSSEEDLVLISMLKFMINNGCRKLNTDLINPHRISFS